MSAGESRAGDVEVSRVVAGLVRASRKARGLTPAAPDTALVRIGAAAPSESIAALARSALPVGDGASAALLDSLDAPTFGRLLPDDVAAAAANAPTAGNALNLREPWALVRALRPLRGALTLGEVGAAILGPLARAGAVVRAVAAAWATDAAVTLIAPTASPLAAAVLGSAPQLGVVVARHNAYVDAAAPIAAGTVGRMADLLRNALASIGAAARAAADRADTEAMNATASSTVWGALVVRTPGSGAALDDRLAIMAEALAAAASRAGGAGAVPPARALQAILLVGATTGAYLTAPTRAAAEAMLAPGARGGQLARALRDALARNALSAAFIPGGLLLGAQGAAEDRLARAAGVELAARYRAAVARARGIDAHDTPPEQRLAAAPAAAPTPRAAELAASPPIERRVHFAVDRGAEPPHEGSAGRGPGRRRGRGRRSRDPGAGAGAAAYGAGLLGSGTNATPLAGRAFGSDAPRGGGRA